MGWNVNNHVTLIGRVAGDLQFSDEDDVRYACFDLALTEADAFGRDAGTHLYRISCRYFESGLTRQPRTGDVLVVQGTLWSRLLNADGQEQPVHEVRARGIRLLQDLPDAPSIQRLDNHVMLVGRLATRPEPFGQGDDLYGAHFDLATTPVDTERHRARDRTHLHRIVCSSHQAADACRNADAGDVVVVQGALWSRWIGEEGREHVLHEVRAHGVQLILPGGSR